MENGPTASTSQATGGIQLNTMPGKVALGSRNASRYDSIAAADGGGTSTDDDSHKSDLNVWQGAALLTADCLGTGILALPQDIAVLGPTVGISLLIFNMFINFYAGTILSHTADHLEGLRVIGDGSKQTNKSHESLPAGEEGEEMESGESEEEGVHNDGIMMTDTPGAEATHDFCTMAAAMFQPNPDRPYLDVNRWVIALFYTNIFLVLGDYILVMSHAVSALAGDVGICLPTAGLFASTLMFAVAQLKSMASLGRSVSIISLASLAVVIVLCVYHHRNNGDDDSDLGTVSDFTSVQAEAPPPTMWQKLSALGSIGFAMGSQKLLLNIRHELADRTTAPKSLGISLTAFTTGYIGVVAAAGTNPPGFLFDAIPPGLTRRSAGLFLWIHVAVSYAINSQALCASIERTLAFPTPAIPSSRIFSAERLRWLFLTGMLAIFSFFVANAVPFFKDLVAFCGALTTVPLTLLLPAIYFRQLLRTRASMALLIFSVAFMLMALTGSIESIGSDWKHQTGGFFACHQG